MRKKFLVKALVFILILNVLTVNVPTVAVQAETSDLPEIVAESAIVYALSTNEVIFEKESEKKYYPSAVIKMMTAIVSLKNASLGANQIPSENEIVTVGKELNALSYGYNGAGFKIGDKVSLPDLLKALIIGNADDAAIILAVYIGRKDIGGIYNGVYGYDKDALDHFVDMMLKFKEDLWFKL